MKESDWESARFARQGFQDGTVKKRSQWNSKVGRVVLLVLFTVVCIVAGNSRLLVSSLFIGKPFSTEHSQVEDRFRVVEQGDFAAHFDEALIEEDPFVRDDATSTDVDKASQDDRLKNLEGDDELKSKEDPVEDNGNEFDGVDARAEADNDAKPAEDVPVTLDGGTLKEEARDSVEDGVPEENNTLDGGTLKEEARDTVEDGVPEENNSGVTEVADAVSYLTRLATNLTKSDAEDNGPYHSRRIFEMEYEEMKRSMRIFVYPVDRSDPFANVFTPINKSPTGNYASEEFFQQALYASGLVTKNASEAHFFFMPVSITKARLDARIKVEGLRAFCAEYVMGVREQYGHWNRSNGGDHFYLSCHSIARGAMDAVPFVRANAIQLLCPSSYKLSNYITHKDASVPQIWPRPDIQPRLLTRLDDRTRLAFFAGATNSPVRLELLRVWGGDDKIFIHKGKVPFPYAEGLMTSKFCLQVKGFEVNTARLGDAMFYGCVPVIIADQYDLPWQDVLDWTRFSIVVAHEDIPLLKTILEGISKERYAALHRNLMMARKHFIWHNPAEKYDAFFTVMSELWKRRHLVRRQPSHSYDPALESSQGELV